MPIYTFDTETESWSKNIICASICNENMKTETYDTKKDTQKRILEIAKKEEKRGHKCYFYAHYLPFDYYRLFDYIDGTWKFASPDNPMIAYKEGKNGKPQTYLLDTTKIFRGNLKQIGHEIGLEKLEMPKEIQTKKKKDLTKEELTKIKEYNQNDCKILMKALQETKQLLKNEGLATRNLFSIGQIAIKSFNHNIRTTNAKYYILGKPDFKTKGKFRIQSYHNQPNADTVHKACKGGRVQAFQTGTYTNANYIDCNSLYPYAATQITFPMLNKEKHIKEPLKHGYKVEDLLETTNATECMITMPERQIGDLAIRFGGNQDEIYPKHQSTLIGTWTNYDLQTAIKNGGNITHAKTTTFYQESQENPLGEWMKEIYKKRMQNPEKSWFYKALMNNLIGKFCQKRKNETIEIDDINNTNKRLKQGWQIIGTKDTNYIFKKTQEPTKSTHYAPIIYALVTSKARQIMQENLEKFKPEDLLYTDTDSIMYLGNTPETILTGKQMGQFKQEFYKENAIIYGKKNYMIADKIASAGTTKSSLKPEDYLKGTITTRKMKTIKTAEKPEQAGEFTEKTTDLNESTKKWKIMKTMEENTEIFIDTRENPEYWVNNGFL